MVCADNPQTLAVSPNDRPPEPPNSPQELAYFEMLTLTLEAQQENRVFYLH